MENKKIEESGAMDSYEINEIWVNWPVKLPENLKGAKQLAVEIDEESLPKGGMPVTVGPHKIVLHRPGYQPIEALVNIEGSNDGKPLELGEEWEGKQWVKKSGDRIGDTQHSNVSGVSIYDRNEINKLSSALEKEQKEKKIWLIAAIVSFAAAILFLILWLTKEPEKEDRPEEVIINNEIEYVDTIPQSVKAPEEEALIQQQENDVETPSEIQQLAEDVSLEAAINYLDNNSEWVFADMDAYSDLRGLYMALDQYNVNKLSTYWADKLKGSKKFRAIAAQAKKNDMKGVQRVRLEYQPKAFGSDMQSLNPGQYVIDLSNMLKEWNELTRNQIDYSDE